MLTCLYFLGHDHAARDDSSWFACAVDWWAHYHIAHQQQYLVYHHSFQLNTNTNQRDTLSHNQCNHRLPPSFHTVNTPHYNTAMPGLQPLPHYNTATPGFQASPPQCGSSFAYQPTSHPTSTTPAQPLPTMPASQQYPPTNVPAPPQSHAKHSRTRSRTTRKHSSTSKHRRQHRFTKRHHTRYTPQHRSTTPPHRRHTSQHRSRRRQHHSPTVRSRSNHWPRTRHRTTSLRQHTPPRHHTSLPRPQPRPLPPPPLPPQHYKQPPSSTSIKPSPPPTPPSLADQIRSVAMSRAICHTTTPKTITAGLVHLKPRQQHTPPAPPDTTTTKQPQSDDLLQEAIEQQIQQDPSVLTPWEPPIRDSYQAFNYRELEQRLHSAALRARELTAPSVYFRFLADRDTSVRDMAAWLETPFPADIDLPQEHITTSLAKYNVTTGMPMYNTLTHTTFHQNHSTLANITSIWILEPDPNFSTPAQHLHGHECDDVELPLLPTDVQKRGCWGDSFTSGSYFNYNAIFIIYFEII